MKVTGVEEFGDIKLSEAVTITNDLFFEGVILLDVSTPSTLYDEEPYATQSLEKMSYGPHKNSEYVSFLKVLLSMLPCLQELDLSNTDRGDEMQFASFPCSDCLEKLTWNGLIQRMPLL